MRKFMLSSLVLGLLTTTAMADVLRVPQDHLTIQGAVNAANDGDVILIVGGTYAENVVVNNVDNLLIRGKGTTVIQAGGGYAMRVLNSSGVTLQKLSMSAPGGVRV